MQNAYTLHNHWDDQRTSRVTSVKKRRFHPFYPGHHCFETRPEDNSAYVKVVPHLTPHTELDAWTMDLVFTLTAENYEPAFVSYVAFDTEGSFKEVMSLYLPTGRLCPFYAEDAECLALYTGKEQSVGVPVRVTITGNMQGYFTYFDGEFYQKQDSGRKIPLGGSWVLGQFQRTVEGGFVQNERFEGFVCDFQMWDFKMNEDQLKVLFSQDMKLKGNLFNSPPTYKKDLRHGALEHFEKVFEDHSV